MGGRRSNFHLPKWKLGNLELFDCFVPCVELLHPHFHPIGNLSINWNTKHFQFFSFTSGSTSLNTVSWSSLEKWLNQFPLFKGNPLFTTTINSFKMTFTVNYLISYPKLKLKNITYYIGPTHLVLLDIKDSYRFGIKKIRWVGLGNIEK